MLAWLIPAHAATSIGRHHPPFSTALPADALSKLATHGYAVVPNWLAASDAAAVLSDAKASSNAAHSAAVGGIRGQDGTVDDAVRRSKTLWLQQPKAKVAWIQQPADASRLGLVSTMEALRSTLAKQCAASRRHSDHALVPLLPRGWLL